MYTVYDAQNGKFNNDHRFDVDSHTEHSFHIISCSPPKQVRTFYHFEFSDKSESETEIVSQSPPKSYCTGYITFSGGKLIRNDGSKTMRISR